MGFDMVEEPTDLSAMSEEQAAEVLEKWQTWMGMVGPALVDVGSPFGEGTAVIDDGSSGPASRLSGYSIVGSATLAEAADLAEGHPFPARVSVATQSTCSS
jgi:hypothetical protein